MNLAFRIARRYLFAKKSTNAINVISGISVVGLAVGTAALILVLSVFNGFEDLITSLYSTFEPNIKVQPAEGKVFVLDSIKLEEIKKLEGVEHLSKTLEEVAMFEYKGAQSFGLIKGVDEHYAPVTSMDSVMYDGIFKTQEGAKNFAIVGYGMQNKLSISLDDYFETLSVYMAKRKKSSLDQPFRRRFLYPIGVYKIQTEYDEKYVLTNLAFAQELRGYYDGQVSALEIKLDENADEKSIIKKIKTILGEAYLVKNQYQQNEAFLKLMNIEKWLGFAIAGLTLILVAFNLIGTLLMIIIDKKKDIAILKSMGATRTLIRNIFLGEGMLLAALGIGIGFFVAIVLIVLQKTIGIIQMQGFIVESYPISMRFMDFIIVIFTVFIITFFAAWLPANRAAKVEAVMQE